MIYSQPKRPALSRWGRAASAVSYWFRWELPDLLRDLIAALSLLALLALLPIFGAALA